MSGVISGNYPNLYDKQTGKQIGYVGANKEEHFFHEPNYRKSVSDIPDQIEVTFGTNFENLTENTSSGGGMTAAIFANRFNYGTEIGWVGGTVMVDGNFVRLFKAVSLNLSNMDNLLFEIGFPENHNKTRLQIIISSDNILTNSSRFVFQNGAEKSEISCFVLRKSNFSTFTGTGVNWANVVYIEFRFTSQMTTNADLRRSVLISRMTVGGYTKPTVILSHDDISDTLLGELPTIQSRNIPGTHFVTDSQIMNNGTSAFGKMTKAQIDQWLLYGWNVCAHNIGHKPFAIPISGYSKSVSTITMTLAWGSSTDTKDNITLNIGDSITINKVHWYSVNGTYIVQSVSLGTSQTTITFDAGNTIPIDSQSGLDGGVLTINKNNVAMDNKLLNGMIESMGYLSDPEIMAYTYGHNSNQTRQNLFSNGVKIARSTSTRDGFFVFQLRQNLGISPSTLVSLTDNTPQFNGVLLSIPTMLLSTLSGLQAQVNNLLNIGGFLSVYWHGDEVGMTTTIMVNSLNYLADLRDQGLINIINMSELKKIVEHLP